MKHFGTVKSFDDTQGSGSITPETGGEDLRFEKGAFAWADKVVPTTGQRLSYELAHKEGVASAINLATI
jgi:CspA family cold shock protein